MTIEGSPKVLAKDIAEGFGCFTASSLRRYTPQDLRIIKEHIRIIQREIRAERIDSADTAAMKKRNMKLQRLSQAVTIINAYCQKNRIFI